jgi:hypothetical protein
MMKPMTVPMLPSNFRKNGRCMKKLHVHRQEGGSYNERMFLVVFIPNSNESRPGAEEDDDVPASEQGSGKEGMHKFCPRPPFFGRERVREPLLRVCCLDRRHMLLVKGEVEI